MKLYEILENHKEWVMSNGDRGVQADLAGANLIKANLTGANLIDADLTGANLAGADLRRTDLRRVNLTGANLIDADLTGANLAGADLSRANLAGANLSGANLIDADLTGANLRRANLSGTQTTTKIAVFSLGTHNGYLIGRNLTIGCRSYPIDIWLEHYTRIGQDNSYSDAQIEDHFELIKAFDAISKKKELLR